MEISATDDKPTPMPAYSGPAPPMHHRIPHPDGGHGPPSDSVMYEAPPWRPYPASFEGRRTSNAPQPPLPPPGYPVHPNRELPQLPPEVPYNRQGSLPGAFHTISDAHPPPHPPYRPMNGTPHEAASHSAPPDYRPRMSFPPPESQTNGDPPPPPPPPHSLPPAQYGTPVPPHISHTPAPYDPAYYQNQAYGRQRKAARAQQACDQCRARKAKCDEGRPACSHCKENNMICVYKEVPPHKQEKSTQMLIDRLAHLEDIIYEKTDIIQKVQVEHGNQLTQIIKNFPREPKVKMNKESQKPTVQHLLKQDSSMTQQESAPKEESVPVPVGQELTSSETTEAGTVTVTTQETLEPGEDGELSIPVEHTTAAHKLLMWPSIKELLLPREYDEDYVMRLEEKRGLIRVYGRGEGDDTSDDVGPFPPPTRPDYSPEEHHTQTAPTSGPWGVGATPPPTRLPDNGLDESGFLTTDPETLRRYHRSYMDHIHRLHPFLNQSELDAKIGQFIKTYCPRSASDSPSVLSNSTAGDIPRGAKRKRSCENLQGAACDMQSPTGSKTGRIYGRRIERSVGNAIILLVFAIGSICEVSIVPGPVMDDPVDFRKERIPGPTTRSVQSPAGSDSILQTQGNVYAPRGRAFPSPSVIDGRKSASGRSGYMDTRNLRNLDVIPGLAYYAYATQIIGSLQGANGLFHVQAALLAGLYAGQLAHPFQSHGWIYQAARACQVLVRTKRYEQLEDGPMKDLYDFAYWTCLQLESDILAELDLPASGISRSEARISLPKGLFTLSLPNEISAPSTMMMFFYSAQIHLRKVLNRVHTDLYKVEKQGQNRWSSNVQEILSMNLELWRTSLPDIMKWKDNDPPPKEINVARMRAKYYGARYIIHRPLLYHALHYAAASPDSLPPVDSPTAPPLSGSKSQQVSPSMTHSQRASNMVRLGSDLGTMGRNSVSSAPGRSITYRDLPTKLRRACKVCVDSAILSTEAFDGIEGRPVVTNIFGTAHAQFGNMLVLSATYMSNLTELVDRNDLERLLKRTIAFLLQSRYISPSLRADARILTEIYEKIFGEPVGSFSSVD
ncbi:putative C6 finger domain protein [Aspergillus melleus]|uniref:putative C6 finger domain protein n=1 Tax=Aspergillus melleus TaxID=138277 RepID=UPI001E8DA1F5|nr:uncharacterized protein LDX57_003349 [Aspergillus melleus]KAH8425600.1 hypothetical protein LDX57_003349 [Aspergillus melleus]